MKSRPAFVVIGAVVLLLVLSGAALASTIERVSVSSSEIQGDGDSGGGGTISGYGRYVAFESAAANLVAADANGEKDIFVRDRLGGTTVRVSVDSGGVEGNGPSYWPSINADGRYVAFESVASNLVAGDTNGCEDVFIRDIDAFTTSRVSVGSGGQGNASSSGADINGNGRYVVFHSAADNLVYGDTNARYDIFLRDLMMGGTVRVSVGSGGAQGTDGSYNPSISADGRYVAFHSDAPDLVTGDTNARPDVFVRDVIGGTTTRVSVTSSGGQGNNESYGASISADGRYVAFTSIATNLVSGDSNGRSDVFVRDLVAGTTIRVSLSSSGTQGNDTSDWASISADGLYVAFDSSANNLVSGDTNDTYDVFVRDRVNDTTRRVNVDSNGAQGNAYGYNPSISPDGGYVTFWSYASNLVPGDTNDRADAFVAHPLAYVSIRGIHRYETAQLISRAMFPTALPDGSGVVVAPGETFPEALCGAPLAAAWGGPVLLTPSSGLENGTKAELQRLAPDYVFCIGLSTAVVDLVEAALPTLPVNHVVPIRGSSGDIYDMSAKVALELESRVGSLSSATAIVTVGTNFPDAIAVSPLACYRLWPVILADKADNSLLPAGCADILSYLGITKAIKVGTYATLPVGVAGLANLSGVDRYFTNANVAVWAKANAGSTFAHTGFATGDKFPDALAAGPYLAKNAGTLLLSPLLGPVPAPVSTALTANRAAVDYVTFIACIEPVNGQVKALLP